MLYSSYAQRAKGGLSYDTAPGHLSHNIHDTFNYREKNKENKEMLRVNLTEVEEQKPQALVHFIRISNDKSISKKFSGDIREGRNFYRLESSDKARRVQSSVIMHVVVKEVYGSYHY